MKVTKFSPGGLPAAYGAWSTGSVSSACEAETASISSNSLAIGGVIISGSAASNYHILASGSNYAAWVPDSSGGGSVSYGSNAMSVTSANDAGVDTDVAREDHRHEGVHQIYSNGSNARVGDVTLQAGANVALAVAAQIITISATGVPGPTGPAGGSGAANPDDEYVIVAGEIFG